MIVIGITGPTGAGKTTALNQLEALGGCVLDADAVYHQLLEEDDGLRHALESRFGPLTGADGRFDRKKLGGVVFHDRAAMADLNAIVTPYIDRALKTRLAAAEQEDRPAAAIDAIRLIENGLADLCDATLAVTAPAEVRVGRIMAREGIPEEYARARVAAQHSDAFYRDACGYTLVNDCATAEEFGAKARALLERILQEHKGR